MTTIGISDMKMIRNEGELITYALGSCIGICLYDPAIKLAAMVHVLLPSAPAGEKGNLFKYADTGILETLRKMEVFGAVRRRMTAKIAGGAKMFDIPGNNEFGNIGTRNSDMSQSVIQREGIRLLSKDVGGTVARTLLFSAATGDAVIKQFGRQEKHI